MSSIYIGFVNASGVGIHATGTIDGLFRLAMLEARAQG
jgi:hypothetical protein